MNRHGRTNSLVSEIYVVQLALPFPATHEMGDKI